MTTSSSRTMDDPADNQGQTTGGKKSGFGIIKLILLTILWIVILLVVLVITPFWLVTVKILSWIGSDKLRVRRGWLQLPIKTYQNKNGQTIVMVCVMHVASPTYYAFIRKTIAEYEAKQYRVLYELVDKSPREEMEKLPENTRLILRWLANAQRTIRHATKGLRTQSQLTGLPIKKSWINTDMTIAQLLTRLAPVWGDRLSESTFDVLTNHPDQAGPLLKWVYNRFFSWGVVLYGLSDIGRFMPFGRGLHQVILVERNDIAYQAIQEHLPQANIVSIWGAAHISDMHRRLRRDGFRIVSVIWVNAYRIKRIGLFGTIRTIIRPKGPRFSQHQAWLIKPNRFPKSRWRR
ncbi:hypothetical protein HGA91_03440 [candidate division WWE3 bacterium]|nr:hypothetical protein [candidate division WWE3 bacterium]